MLISVIVPVYKVEEFIYRCIKSIMMQTLNNFELILVDDGSFDKCGHICDAFAMLDDRIYVIHKPNGGLSDARNAGIDWSFVCSDSEWLNFIDSDDWVHPKYLEALYNAVIETKCQIGICSFQKTLSDELVYENTDINIETVNTEDFFCEQNVNAVVAWGKLYKKELFEKIRYPLGKLHEDEFTTYKLLFQYPQISVVPSLLYYYYCNPNSITQSDWSPKKLDALEAIKQNINFFEKEDYRCAYVKSVEKLRWGLNAQYNAIVNSNNVYSCYKDALFKNYRFLLRKGKKVNMFPFKKNIYYYERAYPIRMKYYWILKAILPRPRR